MTVPFPTGPVPGALRLCRMCRQPLPQTAPPNADICGAPICENRARVEASAKLAQARTAAKARQVQMANLRTDAVFAAAAAEMGVARADIAEGVVPHVDPNMVAPDPEERAGIISRIERIVEEAFDPDPADPMPLREWERPEGPDYARRDTELPDDPLALAAGCVACQGKCCMSGRRGQAFLTPRTIGYYRRRHPEATPEDIVTAYLARLPEQHIQRSCQFHTNRGCQLERDMRSEICNRFKCSSLKAFAEDLSAKGEARAVVIGLAADHDEHPEAGADYAKVVVVEDGQMRVADAALPALPESE